VLPPGATLVAILATVTRNDPVATWQHALVLTIAFYASAGLVSGAFLTRRPRPAPPLTRQR
jgi:hypothetical protein